MRKPLALTVAAVAALACCASAQASTSQRAYHITIRMYKQQLAVSHAQLNSSVATVQAALSPCIPTLAADTNIPADSAADNTLQGELAAQYLGVGAKPVLAPELAAMKALARLPVPSSARAGLTSLVQALTALGSLNTCADLDAWQAAGFAPSAEPAGTTASESLQSVSVKPVALRFKVTRAEHKRLKKAEKKALAAINKDLSYVAGTLTPWLNTF